MRSTSTHARWGGPALMLGALMFMLTKARGYVDPDDSMLGVFMFVGFALWLAGVAALYARYGDRAGWPGKLGLLIVMGGVLALAVGHVVTWLLETADLFMLVALGVLALISGVLVFGVAALRTEVLPRWRFVPLATGVAGFAWIFFTNSETSRGSFLALRTLFGLGWLLLGYVLWSDRQGAAQKRTVKASAFGVLMAAMVLPVSVLALVITKPAEAAFPGINGKIAFVSHRDGDPEIYAMNPDGFGQIRLTNNLADDTEPAYSSDGKKIAFSSDRYGTPYGEDGFRTLEVHVMNPDGSGQKRLTNNPAQDYGPAFSPDGKRIAFVSTRDGNSEIYTMNADGSGQTRVTNNAESDSSPAWSPDGTRIAFESRRDGRSNIYTMSADGSEVTRLTNNFRDSDPNFSPDGTKIAFESDRAGYSEINVMNVDGSNQTRLTYDPPCCGYVDDEPSFSPDGTRITFYSGWDGAIYTMNADGSDQTKITDGLSRNLSPDWGTAPHPTNDGFAQAWVLRGNTASVGGTTKLATREAGEPDHYTPVPGDSDWQGDHTVWYRWKAPASGFTTIDTCTSNIDGILAVYTGSRLDVLSKVADSNNDCPSGWGSMVTFDARVGTTYHVAVGDAGGLRENTFTLKLAAPPDTTAPEVSSTKPADGAKGVRRAANVTATFSEDMDPNRVNHSSVWLINTRTEANVIAAVSYDEASRTVRLNPSVRLASRTKYEARIAGAEYPCAARDLSGNPLAATKVWTFTTGRR